MKAMIFAAGKGTRLKPLTDEMPKALVPVAEKPLLRHVMEKLYDNGFNDIVINVHHFADMIEERLPELTQGMDVSVHCSDERKELLETGGGIKHAAPLLKDADRFLIHNCDILSNVNLKDFWQQGAEAEATLLVSERDTQRYLIFDKDMRLVGWTNIKTGEVKSPYPAVHQAFNPEYVATEIPYAPLLNNNSTVPEMYQLLAFAGIHQMSTSLLPEMDSWPERFSIIDFYLEQCATHVIKGYVQPGLNLMDVGKLDTLSQAEQFINKQ
ncbi:MAG: NTP transferase domain-containing protein [Prevotella sp.]|nr:NTP transferase domain-containing protein [Candidatus Prevotella equi]